MTLINMLSSSKKIFLPLIIILASLAIAFLTPLKVLALLFALLLLALSFYRPIWIIFFLALYTSLEPFLLKFIPDDLYVYARYFGEFLIYAIVLTIILKLISKKIKLVNTPLNWPFITLVIISVASFIFNLLPLTTGLLGLRMIFRFLILFFVIVHLKPNQLQIKTLTWLMILMVFFQATLGLTQKLIGYPLDNLLLPRQEKVAGSITLTSGTDQVWAYGERIFGTLGRYDQLGTFLAFFMLLIVGLLYQKYFSQKNKFWIFIWLVISATALLFTYSRSSWFGFLLGVFVIGYLIKKDKKIIKTYALAVGAIIIYLIFSPVIVSQLIDTPQSSISERFLEAFSKRRWEGEYYGLGRLFFIVKTPTVVVASSPFFGVGPGQYGGGTARALNNTTVYDKLSLPFGIWGTEGYIDNNWMSLWGEIGTLGLICYLWLIYTLFKMSYGVYKKAKDNFDRGLALGYCGVIVAVCLNAFLATMLEIRTLALYFWLFGGIIYLLNSNLEIKNSKR